MKEYIELDWIRSFGKFISCVTFVRKSSCPQALASVWTRQTGSHQPAGTNVNLFDWTHS